MSTGDPRPCPICGNPYWTMPSDTGRKCHTVYNVLGRCALCGESNLMPGPFPLEEKMTDVEQKKKKIDEVCQELDAMKAIAQTLEGLDEEQVKRVLGWVWKTYVVDPMIERIGAQPADKSTPAEKPVDLPPGPEPFKGVPWIIPQPYRPNPWVQPYRPEVVAYAITMEPYPRYGESYGDLVLGDVPDPKTTTTIKLSTGEKLPGVTYSSRRRHGK